MAKTKIIIPEGTFGPLKSKDNEVRINSKPVVRLVGNTAFIDTQARSTSNVDAHVLLDGLVAKVLPDNGYSVRYTDSILKMLNPQARFRDFVERGELSGVELTAEEKVAAANIKNIYDKFVEAFTPPQIPYVRQEIPKKSQENPLSNVSINKEKTSVTHAGYTVALDQIEKLWTKAANRWKTGKKFASVSAGTMRGYTIWVYPSRVDIGCRSIPRWQIEALAEKMGWEFPSYQEKA